MEDEIDLGDVAKDSITGMEGVVMGVTKWLYGCERLSIQPQELKDGKPIDCVSFDRPQLVLVKKRQKPEDKKTRETGGPRPEPTRNSIPR